MEFGILLALLLAAFSIFGGEATTFTITNNCPYPIWPATLTLRGSPVSSSGFVLATHETKTIESQPLSAWFGKIWARTFCNRIGMKCGTGDCGDLECSDNATIKPPATLIDFNLNVDDNLSDDYDISLVHGFNLPVRVFPQEFQTAGKGCLETNCVADINAACSDELAVRNQTNAIIGCKSACDAFNQPQYCCTGDYDNPDKCKPTKYSQYFKAKCPRALSYPYDDRSSCTFTCPTRSDYVITFCP